MAFLAEVSDVEDSLGRSLTGDEVSRVEALILLASAAVENETRFKFAAGNYTLGRKVRAGQVWLPAVVSSVSEVRAVDQVSGTVEVLTDVADYTVRGSRLHNLRHCFVEVDFAVTALIPDEVVGVVAGIVASTVSGPPVGATQESTGPFTISYVNSSGKVWLSASDKAILSRYRQPKPALSILG